MEKDFDRWNKLKKQLDARAHLPTFNAREIWWCSIGMNVGYEIYGKDDRFWRPVLILDKHNIHTFFGLPLGSARKNNSLYYFPLTFKDREGSVLLSQGKTISSKRLSNIMGTVSETKFDEIRQAYIRLFQ